MLQQSLLIIAIIGAIAGILYLTIHLLKVMPIFTLGDPISEDDLNDEREITTDEIAEIEHAQQRAAYHKATRPRIWSALLGIAALLTFLLCTYFLSRA